VISAENADMKLLPGMTATVRVVTDQRVNALKVPNAALRFRPPGAPTQGLPGQPAGGGQRIGAGLENLARTLTDELKLTSDQQRALEEIVAETRGKFAELAQPEVGNSARVARSRFLRNEMNERITTVLTPEQRPQFAALRATRGAGGSGQIWVMGETGALRAVPVRLGIGDGTFTEIVRGGSVEEGQTVVVGTARPQTTTAPAQQPQRRLGF
jgi:HlyD family secretion protein